MRLSSILAGVAVLLACGAARAHEIGTTRVSVRFQQDRTYDIEIVTDGAALAEKLEASAGSTLPPSLKNGTDAQGLERLLAGFDEAFRRRIKIAFDGLEVHPRISYSVDPPIDVVSAAAATIRLTGEIPRDAQQPNGWKEAKAARRSR